MIMQDVSTLFNMQGNRELVMRTAQAILEEQVLVFKGVKYLNMTPHVLSFGSGKHETEGYFFMVQPSGYVVNGVPDMELLAEYNGVERWMTIFLPTSDSVVELLNRLTRTGVIVIGSQIAAQAYPMLVHSVIAATGYERALPAEKRMNAKRFNVYPRK
jgi:hypothetical protein